METSLLNLFRHTFAPLPEEYRHIPPQERRERIRRTKRRLGKALLLLAHNYQNDEIVSYADYVGDSYQLSRWSLQHPEAEVIVFCGVSFMAETAYILNEGRKTVLLPSMEAACPLAGMAEVVQVQEAWKALTAAAPAECWYPIVYINSYADLKAFAGVHGGTVCTSANAERAFRRARENGKRIFFLPDKNLGLNLLPRLGCRRSEAVLWNPWAKGIEGEKALQEAEFVFWWGFCQVHDRFRKEHVLEVREKYPDIRVLVHPECLPEVVDLADEVGSTSYIVRRVRESPPGTKWAIGTEFHLVHRLKKEHPEQFIIPLGCEECIDCNAMRQIQPEYLLWVLEELEAGRPRNRIHLEEDVLHWARVALARMLEL